MKLTKLLLVMASFGALLVGSDSAVRAAQTPEQTFHVTAAVVANCTLTVHDFSFGTYDPLAADDTTVSVNWQVRCTKNAPGLKISIGQGENYASPDNRMASTTTGVTDFLKYGLFMSDGTTRWNGTTQNIASPSSGSIDEQITIIGKITALQDASVASYSDAVTATLNY
jgi:spore coat protein U-like protein